ncbi:MAG: hypothetical protein HC890_00005 [Chloroflexaceae bacterium]|nr:hypothetical protein [Chloroflexaceae bacterium]
MTKSLNLTAAPVSPASLAALKQLYQFLTTTQEQLRAQNAFKIVSFAQEIPSIDPLALLDQIAAGDRVHFYWENHNHNEAILAYETVQSLIIDAPRPIYQNPAIYRAMSAANSHRRRYLGE